MTQHGGKAIVPYSPTSYGGPATPTASGPSSKPGKPVSPQPIGTTPAPAGSSPKGKSPAPKTKGAPSEPAPRFERLPRRKGNIITLPWAIITILFIVLAYDVLHFWKESVSIETTGFNAANWAVYALEGKTPPSAAGNPAPSRPGRQQSS